MLNLARWKVIACTAALLFGLVFTLPNVLPKSVMDQIPAWAPHQKLNLGLDLQGGSYLLLEVDTDALKRERLANLLEDVRGTLRTEQIVFSGLGQVNGIVTVRVTDPTQVDAARKALSRLGQPLPGARGGRDMTVQVLSDQTI
jgi:preprotein translocase subunit SecD